MAKYNFKGDVDGISERQLEFINSVIFNQGFENNNVTFTTVGKAGDNYGAAVKRITIERESGHFTMIAKIAPSDEGVREGMNSSLMFNNEHIMYSEVLPEMVQFQKDENIPEEEQLKYAKCYGSTAEQPHEVILLEDLNQLNFTMLDRFKPLSNDCIKSVLKNFALYHSLSYVLKQNEPKKYNDFQGRLIDMWADQANIEESKIFFQYLENDLISVLDNPDHINLVKHKIGSLTMSLKLAKADKDNRCSVILQGDSWTNNIMFRFEDEQLAESIMIDYQLSKSASPVYDIMNLIFNCTDYEMRSKHYYDWIDYYYSELDKSLSNFNLKANFMYPRDKLDADLRRYGKHLFGISVMTAAVLIKKPEDAENVLEVMKNEDVLEQAQEFGVSHLDEESVMRFKNKVIGLINSFTEFGLL